ncbi:MULTISPECIES: TldD/PmbA family protein [Halocynthiibacter]|uniref:TldD/PmbA family protein n=1 Tax=Halocynthiibacter halioticoli TaxID=2986804 RepID=A0AAE3J3C2_9RHOB|nr:MULTISPECIES: TldD/PmbA family protein [Halocynthiibacter]MCV6825691.1 TldD/PmbA family protein [Halocynthiibacter halioticoli]MCW4058692.1 TldD/PmbA family protein [Halocynthiibacter sp. SDUM655004]
MSKPQSPDTNDLASFTEALISAAKKAGAEGADAIAVEGTSVSIDVLGGALEHAERSEGIDIGLRVLIGQKQACVSASDTKTDTIQKMAERAVAMAKEAPDDPHIRLASSDEYAGSWNTAELDLYDATEPKPAELEEIAKRAEAAALAVGGVSQVQATSIGFGNRRLHLSTSNGFSGGYARSGHSISTVAISGKGSEMERDYYGDSRTYFSELESPEEIGRIAGERAVEKSGAQQPQTGAFPVIFDERISGTLIGHLLSAINGSSIVRGSSFLRDRLGEQVLPKGLSLIEEPHRARTSGSRPFDGEGLATQNRMIVDNGILTGWTLDLATAHALGMQSTASASRGTSSPPSPSSGNVSLTQGNLSQADLLREMGTGLLVTSMIGSSINPTTGDYSRGASGFWVENGEIQFPVNECTIAGNLNDMLLSLTPANDARKHLSRVVPSLLVEGMTIAGK